MKKYERKVYYIEDIESEMYIEEVDRKTLVDIAAEREQDYKDGFFQQHDFSDDTIYILYKDGTFDCINEEYDGHHIKRQNIVSILNDNGETDMVWGPYEINEWGVVTVNDEMKISDTNIKYLRTEY